MSIRGALTHNLWSKTLVGFFMSFLLNASLMLNLAYLLPMPRDLYLFLAYVFGFLFWAGLMTVFYCTERLKRLTAYTGLVLLVSVSINSLFYLGVVA